ncbi:MAG TPA: ADOP family duplicated permease [Gemmatimonadaceae bacterium]|nr:ADOP family duplicated permease [Gemmatimonadaceae bacterium]
MSTAIGKACGDDARAAVRALRRRPGFAWVIVAMLALGMASVTAVWSVVDSVVVRGLPFPSADDLVSIGFRNPRGGLVGPSLPMLERWRRAVPGSASAGWQEMPYDLGTPAGARRGWVATVTPDLFRVLGVRAQLGRGVTADDDRPGAPPVIVLSDSLWRDAYGADPNVVGRSMSVDGADVTVIGVMPQTVALVTPDAAAWMPLDAQMPFLADNDSIGLAGAVVRLSAGRDVDGVRRTLASLAPHGVTYGNSYGVARAAAEPLQQVIVGDVRPVLLMLFGASVLVLVVACADAAALLVARAASRRRDQAVRRALGASRARLASVMLCETLVLSAGASVAALLAAPALVGIVRRLGSSLVPRATEIAVRPDAFLVVVGLVVLTTVLSGVIPALLTTRGDAADALRTGGSLSASPVFVRAYDALLVAELAVTVVLLAGAGLLAKSVINLLGTPSGLRTEHVIVATITRPVEPWFRDRQSVLPFVRSLTDSLEATPGVVAVAIALTPPATVGVTAPLRAAGDTVAASWNVVTDQYFRVLGSPVLRGRGFDARDAPASGAGVIPIVVSAGLAHRVFGSANPLGKVVYVPDGDHPAAPWQPRRIIGEVADVVAPGVTRPRPPDAYLPFARMPVAHLTVMMRASLAAGAALGAIRRIVRRLDPAQPVAGGRPLDAVLTESAARPRFYLAVLGTFGAVALLLAGGGMFAGMWYIVQERRREIGIRVAVGAERGDVVRLVLRRVARLLGAGLAIGLSGAWATTRFLRALLSGVSTTDPAVLEIVCGVLVVGTLLAIVAPLLEATRVDPMRVLRSE